MFRAQPSTSRPPLRGRPRPSDVDAVRALTQATRMFRPDEVAIAVELVTDGVEKGDRSEYAFLFADGSHGLDGYICYGRTACTIGTWDLYWIAVSPATQGTGVGTKLLQEVERRLALRDARLVIIETSSLPHYGATRRFYERRGYEVVARVPDFYAPGDDRLIFAKRIHI